MLLTVGTKQVSESAFFYPFAPLFEQKKDAQPMQRLFYYVCFLLRIS